MAEVAAAKVRSPLMETTNRLNSPFPTPDIHQNKPRYDAAEIAQHQASQADTPSRPETRRAGSTPGPEAPASTVLSPPQSAKDDKRLSQASYASTSSSRSKKNYKTHIGPWQLGKTLGKGSSARVRLCRHSGTNQLAAVKIVNRRMAYLVQDSSMAALSKWDSNLPDKINGEMRVPMAIEREVAILKLIEHPNIMKLYDIWENRSEIYLILEYIDQGDLFTFINSRGRLPEDAAICFFRQMISAISYCHSFNLCHRDLKPENILITADYQIKIADFGMAALHQTATHQLATACGSPHYAAPELLKNKQYRGDCADIWSLGVILYAMLSATLPFDDPDLRVMMSKTKKGQYTMPKFLSSEAEDLIRRMLQVNPDRRITMREIWDHPLVQKYANLDDFGETTMQLPETKKGFQYTPLSKAEIDPQLLRQLRSMWHMFSEQDLALKLTCDEPNDQKAFYWLLCNYRSKQLEDFKPEIARSMSDYHHLKPAIWKKRTTRQFEKPKASGHGRSISRFTVISNAADPAEVGTIQSYDPYRGSRILSHCDSQVSQAKVVVHRDGQVATVPQNAQSTRARSNSNVRRIRADSTKASLTSRPQSSRGSLASLRSSRQGTPHVRAQSLRHKRGVDFSHIRKQSNSTVTGKQAASRAGGPGVDRRAAGPNQGNASTGPPSPERTRQANGKYPRPAAAPAYRVSTQSGASVIFREELRHFSDNIAKDCDDAFRTSVVVYESDGDSLTDGERRNRDSNPFSLSLDSPTTTISPVTDASSTTTWNSRPLPPLPKESGDQRQVKESQISPVTPSAFFDGHREFPVEQTARAVPILQSVQSGDRRAVSAPAHSQVNRKLSTLPSINENSGVSADASRIVSAPPQGTVRKSSAQGSVDYPPSLGHTIRVVDSAAPTITLQEPRLAIGDKNKAHAGHGGIGRVLHRQFAYNAEDEDDHVYDADKTLRKKKSWFKRGNRIESGAESAETRRASNMTEPITAGKAQEDQTEDATKRRNFSFPFWKSSNKDQETKMTLEVGDDAESLHAAKKAVASRRPSGFTQSHSDSTRNIAVKQNWLTRLFRVKPSTNYLCMTLSSKRARQEVVILLREWRRYGMRSIQVDKQRNIIFARLGSNNYLELKEVEFAVEIITVIEHGKRQPLSIIRFTQERGAASTLHRIVSTMRIMFESRHLLVTDKNRRKMMIKTLNS